MRYIFPYIFSLVYWLLFFVSLAMPGTVYYTLSLLGIWFLVTVAIVSGRTWYRYWNIWVNILLFLVTSFFFSLTMVSAVSRQIFVMFGGLLGGLLIYMLIRYITTAQQFVAKNYLLVMSFVHIITFWQSSALLYFIILYYDAKILPAAVALTLLTFLLGRGTIVDHGLRKSSSTLVLGVLTVTTLELFVILSLLPIHHYTLATMLATWFFFIIQLVIAGQEVSSRKHLFKRYLIFMLIVMALLLITASWQ